MKDEAEAHAYRVYMSDVAKMACENTALMFGGVRPMRRWAETLEPRKERGAREIARDIMRGAGLKFRKGKKASGKEGLDGSVFAGGEAGAGRVRL